MNYIIWNIAFSYALLIYYNCMALRTLPLNQPINKEIDGRRIYLFMKSPYKMKQELQEVLLFPVEIFWNLEARNLK